MVGYLFTFSLGAFAMAGVDMMWPEAYSRIKLWLAGAVALGAGLWDRIEGLF